MTNVQISNYIQTRDATVESRASKKYTAVTGDPNMRIRLERLAGLMLEHFLPGIPDRDVIEIIGYIFRNQECAAYESSPDLGQSYCALLDGLIQIENNEYFERCLVERSLFCSFHIDSYRLVVSYLRRKSNRPVGLLVTPDVIQTQQALINTVGKNINPGMPERTDVNLFDAESIEGLTKAISFLRQGGILVVYIDGNSGFGGMSARHKSMVRIPFLGGHIMARLGIAQLASRLNMPIVPVYIKNLDNGHRLLRCLSELPPPPHGQREAHIDATRQLYSILEQHVRHHPESWEGWLYVNRFIEQLSGGAADSKACVRGISAVGNTIPSAYQKLVFANHSYALLPYPSQTVLMCKRTLSYRVISKSAIEVLNNAAHTPIDAATIAPWEIVSELIQLGMLVPPKKLN
jgi:lauroyl/myristoyl acyltransferase